MTKDKPSLFPERVIEIAGQKVRIRALNLHELMVDVPDLVLKILDEAGKAAEDNAYSAVIKASSKEIFSLLVMVSDRDEEFWKNVSAQEGIKAVNAFLELNLDENFFDQLSLVIKRGKQLGLRLFRS